MEKVRIDFCNIKYLIETVEENLNDYLDLVEDYEEDEIADDVKQYHDDIDYLNTLKDGVEVTTMKEYVKLLERIDELTDGEYEIRNCGTLIEF